MHIILLIIIFIYIVNQIITYIYFLFDFTIMMKKLISVLVIGSLRCKDALSLRVFAAMEFLAAGGIVLKVIEKGVFAVFTCVFALGGALLGIVVGAMKGQTTETGFLRGSGIGAVTGAITAVQLVESFTNGEPLSKLALLCSLMNGKVFMEWVSPAVLKAYQWQINSLDLTYREISDIYDTNGIRGLSQDYIQKIPKFTFGSRNKIIEHSSESWLSCSICLQELKDGESMRKLDSCGHYFHLNCLDKWLTRNGTCPMCRNEVL